MSVIAEALNERKTLYTVAKATADQIAAEAVVEKKSPDTTKETVDALVAKLEGALTAATTLTVRLNRANNTKSVTFNGATISLMEAIALRDELTLRHSLKSQILAALDAALGKGKGRHSYYYSPKTKDTVKEVSLIDRDVFRKELDNLAEQRRLLDIEIQKVNWSAEL